MSTSEKPFRLYRVISGNIKTPDTIKLLFIQGFETAAMAAKHLKSKEFIQTLQPDTLDIPEDAQFVIVSEHQHYMLVPVTKFFIKSLPKKCI